MIYRSLLFAPGDSGRKIDKALASSADAIILDLEDSVTAENRPAARKLVVQALTEHGATRPNRLWVRINPVPTTKCLYSGSAN